MSEEIRAADANLDLIAELRRALADLLQATYPLERRYEATWSAARVALHTGRYTPPDGQQALPGMDSVFGELERRASALADAAEAEIAMYAKLADSHYRKMLEAEAAAQIYRNALDDAARLLLAVDLAGAIDRIRNTLEPPPEE